MHHSRTYSCYLRIFLLLFVFACHHNKKVSTEKKQSVQKTQRLPQKDTRKDETAKSGSELQNKLHLSAKEITGSALYSFVSEWYAVPYKYGGCTKNGVDCSCFANLLYLQVYKRQLSRSANDIFLSCEKKNADEAREGDLVFFKIGGNAINHVAVYLRNGFFVHSSTSKGVILNSIDEAYYKKFLFCAGRVKNS